MSEIFSRALCLASAALLALGFIFLVKPATGQEPLLDSETAKLFADYPKSGDLDYFVGSHRNMKWVEKAELILYGTWFLDGNPQIGMQCLVNDKGAASTGRYVHNWAVQATSGKQLTEAQLESLRVRVRALSEGARTPPLTDLLILSFRDGKKWVTRTYDKRKSLEELRGIYEITGCAGWLTKR
jgi:hypothetical protein